MSLKATMIWNIPGFNISSFLYLGRTGWEEDEMELPFMRENIQEVWVTLKWLPAVGHVDQEQANKAFYR